MYLYRNYKRDRLTPYVASGFGGTPRLMFLYRYFKNSTNPLMVDVYPLRWISTVYLTVLLCLYTISCFGYFEWKESSYSDFADGYFFRSTATATTNNLKISIMDDWLDQEWKYRIPIMIDNSTSTAKDLDNCAYPIVINTQSLIATNKMRADGGDVRFTDTDGKTLLPFWIELSTRSLSSEPGTVFWVRIPLVNAGTKRIIYVYYNNPVATFVPGRDNYGREVFVDLFEDWELGYIHPITWTTFGTSPRTQFEISEYANEGRYAVSNSTMPNISSVILRSKIRATVDFDFIWYWSVSCEPASGYIRDALWLWFAGAGRAIYGDIGWKKESILGMSAAEYDFRFEYVKDISGEGGKDKGWIDVMYVLRRMNPYPKITMFNEEILTSYYYDGHYWSDILDTRAEDSEIIYAVWPTTPTLSSTLYALMYIRVSNTKFTEPRHIPVVGNLGGFQQLNNNPQYMSGVKGRYYQYYLNIKGNGSDTPLIDDVTIRYTNPPTQPSDFNGTAKSTTVIEWTWVDNASTSTVTEDGYRVFTATGGILVSLSSNTVSWTETELLPNTTYSRYIEAYNNSGVTRSTATLTVFTLAQPPDVSPSYYSLFYNTTFYFKINDWTNDANFKFTSLKGVGRGNMQFYRYQWHTSPDHTWTGTENVWVATDTVNLSSMTINLPATENSDKWYLHLRSYNGNNAPTLTGLILGPYYFNGCPAQITDLTVKTQGVQEEGQVILNWTAPSADATFTTETGKISKYQIKYSPYNINSDSAFNSAAGLIYDIATSTFTTGQKEQFVLTGLVPGATYWFAIKAQDESGNLSKLSPADLTRTLWRASSVESIVYLTPSQVYYAGLSGTIITTEFRDRYNNPIKVNSARKIYLFSTSDRATFRRKDESQWFAPAANPFLPVLSGDTQMQFYYKDDNEGNPVITLTELPTEGWIPGRQQQKVNPGAAVSFAVEHDGDGILQVPEPMSISARDSLNNVSRWYLGSAYFVLSDTISVNILPTSHTFTAPDLGKVNVKAYDNFEINPTVVSVYEYTTENYTDLFFAQDKVSGWIVASSGTIKRTNDGGNIWFTQRFNFSSTATITGAYFVNESTGWLVGVNGRVEKTDNSGRDLSLQSSPVNQNWYSVFFTSDTTGCIVGGSAGTAKIIKTYTSGDKWEEKLALSSEPLYSVEFVSNGTGYAVGAKGTVLVSPDYGETWQTKTSVTTADLRGISFFDFNNGWLVGINGTVLRTTDAGSKWDVLTSSITENLNDVFFIDLNTGWTVGTSGSIYKTTNGGMSWVKQTSGVNVNLNAIKFLNPKTGFAVGDAGTILRTIDGGNIWTKYVMTGKSVPFNWNGLLVDPKSEFGDKALQGKPQVMAHLALRNTRPGGNSTWTKLELKRTGTSILDADLNFIGLYRDTGLQGKVRQFDINDDLIAQSTFTETGGKVTLNLNVPQTISYTTFYYYIVYDVGLNATLEKTVGLRIEQDSLKLEVREGSVPLARNNLPFFTTERTIVPSSCTILTEITDVAVNTTRIVEQGDRGVPFYRISLKTDIDTTSPWRGLRVDRFGDNTGDEDIDAVKIYRDENMDNKFNVFDDVFIGSGSFTLSSAIVWFSTPPVLAQTVSVPTTYFVVLDVSLKATPSTETQAATLGLKLSATTDYFLLDPEGKNGLKTSYATYISTTVKIVRSYDIVTIQGEKYELGRLQQGELAPFLRLRLNVNENEATWNKLRVTRLGTASDDDIASLRLYLDNDDDNLFNETKDVRIASDTFKDGFCLLVMVAEKDVQKINRTVRDTRTYHNYFLVIETNRLAIPGRTIGLTLPNTGYLSVQPPDTITNVNFPITSDLIEISKRKDTVTYEITNLAPGTINPGTSNIPVLRLEFGVFSEAYWNRIDIAHGDSSLNKEAIKKIKVYKDINQNRVWDLTEDKLIAETDFSISNSTALVFTPAQRIVYSSTSTYFVVYDLYDDIPADKFFQTGITILNTGDYLELPDQFTDPISRESVRTVISPVQVNVVSTNVTPEACYQGETKNIFKLNVKTNVLTAGLTGFKVRLSTGAYDDVTRIVVYEDINNDSILTQPELVSTSTFNTNKIAELMFSTRTLTTNLATYYITVQVADKGTVTADPATVLRFTIDSFFDINTTSSSWLTDNTLGKTRVTVSKEGFPINTTDLVVDNKRKANVTELKVDLPELFGEYYTNNPALMSLIWKTTMLVPGTLTHYYAIGTSVSVRNVFDWTEPGNITNLDNGYTTVSITGLNLRQGVKYYFYLRADNVVDNVKFTGRTKNVTVTVDLTAPEVPLSPRAILSNVSGSPDGNVIADAFWVVWDAAQDPESGISTYELQERDDTVLLWRTVDVNIPGTKTEYRLTNRVPGKFYYYRLRAKNRAGNWSSFSAPSVSAFVSLPTVLLSEVSVYPNPADTRVSDKNPKIAYKLSADADVQIRIFDLLGSLVTEKNFYAGSEFALGKQVHNFKWDGKNDLGIDVGQGMYLVEIIARAGNEQVRKIVKLGIIH